MSDQSSSEFPGIRFDTHFHGGFMKSGFLTFCFLLTTQLFAHVESVSPVNQLFVPAGFDDNDNVELVATGVYPNSCFIRNVYNVQMKPGLILVYMKSVERKDVLPTKCHNLKVPFKEVISLGSIPAGKYQVVINPRTKFQQQQLLYVAAAQVSSVDDHYYAMVDYVDTGFTGGLGGEALLVGKNPSPCLVYDRVQYLSNGNDTISVLPIMKRVGEVCPNRPERLELPLRFDLRSFKSSKVLIYVRSLDGKSFSTILQK